MGNQKKVPLVQLAIYLCLGFLHEAAHIVAHKCLGGEIELSFRLLCQMIARYCVIDNPSNLTRHAGWIFSLLLAILSLMLPWKGLRFVSFLTTFEAVCYDLLLTNAYAHRILFCGNFGIILLNPYQTSQALDVIEEMIRITMMRGAQSGGIVAFRKASHGLEGVRSRVVNYKRTDLSKLIRRKAETDAPPSTETPGFYGHTRFATSSIASFDGTHPHSWCPPSQRRIYSLSDGKVMIRTVSNFVTHNGDLDFYAIRSKNYGLGIVQKWLAIVLESPMPTSVDSCAIAGLIDLIRCQGCFALAARYAVCFGLSTSIVDDDPVNPPPTFAEYERIGMVFESALNEFLNQGAKLKEISQNPNDREKLKIGTLQKLKPEYDVAVSKTLDAGINNAEARRQPYWALSQYMDEEQGSTLFDFVRITVDAFFDNDLLQTTKIFLKHAKGSFGLMINSTLDASHQFCMAARGQPMSMAFYPTKGIVCYGSEQGAVKAGLAYKGQSISYEPLYSRVSTHFIPLTSDTKLLGLSYRFREEFNRCQLTKLVPRTHAWSRLPQYLIGSYIIEINGTEVMTAGEVRKQIQLALEKCHSAPSDIRLGLAQWCTGDKMKLAFRLDLDDLGGEICLLDWRLNGPNVSVPNQHLTIHRLMDNRLHLVLCPDEEVLAGRSNDLYKRATVLEENDMISAIQNEIKDPVLQDIHDIPKVCRSIQNGWREASLNRLTAWHLRQCILKRLDSIADGKIARHAGSIDILVTGCEVSLWLAEQFATDVQKAFPKLFIKAISSNKILGLFGQEISIPAIGYPMSTKTHSLEDTIILIISHSGGTFAPLACSNLLQSKTKNIFVVSSEWDTQIGKQLRKLHDDKEIISSRIFATGVGVRPAEPCSVSVAATHQLLTNIFLHLSLAITCVPKFRAATGAVVNEYDLKVLERCNQENIEALEHIVGVDADGNKSEEGFYDHDTETELRAIGDLWADHVLENAKAYVMTFLYIVGTVTTGYPLISGIAKGCGLNSDSWGFWLTRFFDSLIYFWLPQINVIILRLMQGRNLKHRMVGRTIVIGDIPWVAQCLEAFLSKLFANSYSIAGLTVLSGNPTDHLVHRHTHRVVRGTLLVCGRPDGRLSALTSAEATVALSVNQASSIQSFGGTCESVTIGHNPHKIPLSHKAVFLDRHRPLFLCETIVDDIDKEAQEEKTRNLNTSRHQALSSSNPIVQLGDAYDEPFAEHISSRRFFRTSSTGEGMLSRSFHKTTKILNLSRHGSNNLDLFETQTASSANTDYNRLLGVYTDLQSNSGKNPLQQTAFKSHTVNNVINDLVRQKAGIERLQRIFQKIDTDGSGTIDRDEFILAFKETDPGLSPEHVLKMFVEADLDGNGTLDFEEFLDIARMPYAQIAEVLQHTDRVAGGLSLVEPSKERYFGEEFRKNSPSKSISSFSISKSHQFVMELYESRIASMQRFVAMCVMFHQLGWRVQSFFPTISLGLLGYRMDRTHSIMRIATTASPVSGADVRERMKYLQIQKIVTEAVNRIIHTWKIYKKKQTDAIVREHFKLRKEISEAALNDSGLTDMDGSERTFMSTTEHDI